LNYELFNHKELKNCSKEVPSFLGNLNISLGLKGAATDF
jgi:hypothetical protein